LPCGLGAGRAPVAGLAAGLAAVLAPLTGLAPLPAGLTPFPEWGLAELWAELGAELRPFPWEPFPLDPLP
jgi:hypothetical protein